VSILSEDERTAFVDEQLKVDRIHHTVGVYNNDSHTTNGVLGEHLKGHIEYNLTFRPGRAFFLNGKCLHDGYLSLERCLQWEKKLEVAPQPKHTLPYW